MWVYDSRKKCINRKNKFILSCSLIILLVVLIIIIIVFAKDKIVQRKNDKKITEYLKSKYNITDIEYIKKDNLLEKYNTTAGDSGSGRRKLKKYIYYYKFNHNNINTYAYIIDDKCSDDYFYEKQLEYAHNEFKKFIREDVTITQDYLDPEEVLFYKGFGDTRATRKAVISIKGFSYDIINKAFIDKYVDIYEKIDSSLNDINLELYIQFKDYIVLLDKYWNGDYKIEFESNNFNNNSSEEFTILPNSTDEAISWCIKNRKSFYDYKN